MMHEIIDFDQGWDYIQKAIMKKRRILEGLPETQFSINDHAMLHKTIYNMCNPKYPKYIRGYSQPLYDKYKEAFEEYITSTVLPSLREKHDECMLRELVKRWANHNAMVTWLLPVSTPLTNFMKSSNLPTLYDVGLKFFRELVYDEFVDNAKDAIITLIDKDREGEQIDRSLLNNVIDIYNKMDYYEIDFEEPLIEDTDAYYSRKASNWILEDTFSDYMLKSEECLKKERDRVSHYLPSSSVLKLVERVQHKLLVVFATELMEKENSGCRALLKDDKVEDLSRMYRLYHKIPKGLEPVANVFKQHITAEGTVLVQQAEDAAMNHAGHAVQEQVLIRKITELHDKYMEYVTNCFQNHTLFHKALKEALEIFCNKTVGGSSSSELLATFCDDILKGGGDKMDDEAIKETLEKVTDLTLARENQTSFEEYLSNNANANP